MLNLAAAGRVIAIVVASISAAVVVILGALIGFYMWKTRIIEKKRKGRSLYEL